MKIKELHAHGFKSFADGIRLEVDEGITAVVGPNGCGKSNIVDALRWVMGELSARHLRGQQMQDVIFGGSEYRKPMGRSEVSLVLSGVAHTLPKPYSGFSELEVARRLYRTGESEYFINKVACRRRDVAELFLECGLGTRTISIIEQGQVGQIVNARPNERRFFIEQAAGILKYKSRREAAVRKLDATKQNLLRVSDVLSELTRQRALLERQAQKAQRYREITEALRRVELDHAAAVFLELDARRSVFASEAQRLGGEQEAQGARLASLEAQIAQAHLERSERESLLSQSQEALFAVTQRIAEVETAQQVAREAIRLHTSNAERAEAEGARLDGRAGQLSEEKAVAAAERERLEEELTGLCQGLALQKQRVEERGQQVAAAEAAREEARARVLATVSQAEARANRLAFLEKGHQETARRIGRLEAERGEVSGQMAELSQTSFGFAEVLKGSRERFEQMGAQVEQARARLSQEEGALDRTRAELAAAKENLSEKATRLSSLREIERRYEGYGSGVQAIMLEAERRLAQEGRNGIYGLVADVLKTRPEYERAVESLLGERLQYVVVKSQEEGVEAVEFLKNDARGRGSFVPLTLRAEPAAAAPREARGEAGVVGALREVVEVKEGYDAVADYLLGDALLVERLDKAVGLWGQSDIGGATLVTLDGDVIDRSGIVTGGTAEGPGAGLLQKKREIDELAQVVEEAGEALRELGAREAQERARVAAAQTQIEELKVRLHRIEIEITSQEKDVERIDEGRAQATRRCEVVEAELAQEGAELARIEEEMAAVRAEREHLEAGRRQSEAALEEAQERLRAEQAQLETALAKLNEAKVTVASLRERAEAAAAGLERLDAASDELGTQREEQQALAQAERAEARRLEEALLGHEAQLAERQAEKERCQGRLAEVRGLFDSGEQQLGGLEKDLARQRAGLDGLRERLSEQTVSLREIEFQIEHVAADMREKYEIELSEYAQGLEEGERTRLTDESVRSELGEELERQRRRLKAVGAVNLDAIEEYDELVERERFLQTQHDDLCKSVGDLEKAITKINRTTRERFRETFEAIDARFREVFPKLFRGGKASLQLTDEANLLETGVEIIAQPPGKKLQDMNMLSGGEKALTAISLLLAIFLIRPAPFVLLDEVDAPLDEANVERFNEVVREMTRHAQVLVITHNKQTMEIADMLVGVTMEEPGVSKLVSVQLT